MTELDDELASAYVDGAATDEERARVEGDPALVARVAELRAARDALTAAPVEPIDQPRREHAIRAAVDAMTLDDLSAARGRRHLRIVSIAAVIVLVLGAAGLLLRSLSNTSSHDVKSAATALGSAPPSTTVPERAAAGAAGPLATASAASLGTFSDRSTLVRAVRAAVTSSTKTANDSASSSVAAPAAAEGRACAPNTPGDADERLFTSAATLDGVAVQVDVFTIVDGSQRLVVTDTATCAEIFSQTL